jgi:hypothetical protein
MRKLIALVALIPLFLIGQAEAAATPDGTIAVKAGSNLTYGGSVSFDTTVSGKVNKQAYVYVSVVCWQGTERVDPVVYQWSSHVNGFVFPLVDQQGQGLEWNGEAADCGAQLIYKLENGPRGSSTIVPLNTVYFGVTA